MNAGKQTAPTNRQGRLSGGRAPASSSFPTPPQPARKDAGLGDSRVGASSTSESAWQAGVGQDRRGSSDHPGAAELEAILHGLIAEHEQLLTLAGAQKKAIREASAASLGPIIESQNVIVQRVAELEKRRLAIVATLGERLGLPRTDRPTLAWLTGGLPTGVSERIMRVGVRLRELLKKLQQENAALREAAGSLATHMEAVMRQVAGKLSHAGIYGRQGTVETRVQVVSGLDLRS